MKFLRFSCFCFSRSLMLSLLSCPPLCRQSGRPGKIEAMKWGLGLIRSFINFLNFACTASYVFLLLSSRSQICGVPYCADIKWLSNQSSCHCCCAPPREEYYFIYLSQCLRMFVIRISASGSLWLHVPSQGIILSHFLSLLSVLRFNPIK